MILKLRVKLGNVTNLSDARYAAGMGVESLGFNVSENSDLPPEQVSEIVNWVSGVDIIGELENSQKPAAGFTFDYLQTSNIDLLSSEQPGVLKLSWNGLTLNDVEQLAIDNDDKIRFLILEIPKSELANNVGTLRRIAQNTPLFISSNFDPDEIDWLIQEINPAGIELLGGKEDKPGFKDYDELANILEALEME